MDNICTIIRKFSKLKLHFSLIAIFVSSTQTRINLDDVVLNDLKHL